MKRIRKWITVFAAIAAALSLTACQGDTSADDRNVSTGSPEGVSDQPSAGSGSQAAELSERERGSESLQ